MIIPPTPAIPRNEFGELVMDLTDTAEHARAVIRRAFEPEPKAAQATIDMVRALRGPPVRREPTPARQALSADTRARLIATAAVGASEAYCPWWTLWLVPVGYKAYREPPRENRAEMMEKGAI